MAEDENPKTNDKKESLAVTGNGAVTRFKPTRTLPVHPAIRSFDAISPQDAQYHALLVERRTRFIDEDPLVKVVDAGGDAFAVLREIKREIAREAASLHFDRMEFEKRGKDPTTVSSRRIEALRRIADIELKIRELDQHALNLSSEKMQRIFALWVETMREIAQEVLPSEVMDLFFNRFATAMEGWEERAQDALR